MLNDSPPKPVIVSSVRLTLILVLLLGLHPVATYLYLPSLPLLQRELGIPAEIAQWSLSALIISFAFGQVLCGPLADCWGRRPVLLWGLGMLVAASIAATMTNDVDVLLAARVIQGLGVAAAGVCARAVLRDLYAPLEGVRLLSLGFTWVGVIALAGPPLGAALAEWGGFRSALGMLAVFSALVLAAVWLCLPETSHASGERDPRARTGLLAWPRMLRHPTFSAYTALAAASYAGHYVFLVQSPFVLMDERGLNAGQYALALSASSAVHLCGTMMCRYWLRGHGIRAPVRWAACATLAGGLSMAGLAWSGVLSPWAVILPQWLFVFGHAIHQSCGQAAVSAPFPSLAGTATSLSGFLLTIGALLLGELLKTHISPGIGGLAYGVGICSALTAAIAWSIVQIYGDLNKVKEVGLTRRSAASTGGWPLR